MDTDGLTPEQRLKIFDRLPKAIRIVLASAPYNFDVLDIREAWDGMRQDGWTPQRAARRIAKDAARMAAKAQWKGKATMDTRDEIERLRDVNATLREALQDITDHFAAVMGGPLIMETGVKFKNGVEGIPTIAKARAALLLEGT